MSEPHPPRAIDKWVKWVAILGPTISGIIFGTAGYVGGYMSARQDIQTISSRTSLLEGWKEKQEDFNKVVIQQIATLQAASDRRKDGPR